MSLLRVPLRLLQGFFFHISTTAPNVPGISELVNPNEVVTRTVSWYPMLVKVRLFSGSPRGISFGSSIRLPRPFYGHG